VETLVLQGSSSGTFAVPKEWTDQFDPRITDFPDERIHILDSRCLLALAELIRNIESKKDVDNEEK
jgi:hypothetical protein